MRFSKKSIFFTKTEKISPHNQALKFASIAGGYEPDKSLGLSQADSDCFAPYYRFVAQCRGRGHRRRVEGLLESRLVYSQAFLRFLPSHGLANFRKVLTFQLKLGWGAWTMGRKMIRLPDLVGTQMKIPNKPFSEVRVKLLNSGHHWFLENVSTIERCPLQRGSKYKSLTVAWDDWFLERCPL